MKLSSEARGVERKDSRARMKMHRQEVAGKLTRLPKSNFNYKINLNPPHQPRFNPVRVRRTKLAHAEFIAVSTTDRINLRRQAQRTVKRTKLAKKSKKSKAQTRTRVSATTTKRSTQTDIRDFFTTNNNHKHNVQSKPKQTTQLNSNSYNDTAGDRLHDSPVKWAASAYIPSTSDPPPTTITSNNASSPPPPTTTPNHHNSITHSHQQQQKIDDKSYLTPHITSSPLVPTFPQTLPKMLIDPTLSSPISVLSKKPLFLHTHLTTPISPSQLPNFVSNVPYDPISMSPSLPKSP